MSSAEAQQAVLVFGKVVLDDGAVLTEPAAIQTICKGQKRTEAYSDTRGSFSFQFGEANQAAAISDASSSNSAAAIASQSPRNPRDCQLQAVLAGFTSQPVELGTHGFLFTSIDVGKVSLHRMQQVEGTSISVTNALAPSPARKALEKGREEEKKSQWEKARAHFEKAVEIYPKYAAAWYELGKLQSRDNDAAGARHSFEQALAADPKYVNPYDGLAQLDMMSRDWHRVVESTEKLLALNPINFPQAYYYNAVGNYCLGKLDLAEKSALQGVRVDEVHQVPKLHYLLGVILLQKQNFQAASEQMQLYLRLASDPADIDQARKGLAAIERQSASLAPLVAAQEP